MNRIRLEKTKVFAFGTILLWSSAFVFTKIALAYFTTSAVGALRYLIASILFIGIASYKKIGLPDGKDIPKFFISGAFGFTFYMIAFNQGSSTLTPGTSSVLIATGPIITALLASIFLKEKVYWLGWVAIFVEFIGIIVLTN